LSGRGSIRRPRWAIALDEGFCRPCAEPFRYGPAAPRIEDRGPPRRDREGRFLNVSAHVRDRYFRPAGRFGGLGADGEILTFPKGRPGAPGKWRAGNSGGTYCPRRETRLFLSFRAWAWAESGSGRNHIYAGDGTPSITAATPDCRPEYMGRLRADGKPGRTKAAGGRESKQIQIHTPADRTFEGRGSSGGGLDLGSRLLAERIRATIPTGPQGRPAASAMRAFLRLKRASPPNGRPPDPIA